MNRSARGLFKGRITLSQEPSKTYIQRMGQTFADPRWHATRLFRHGLCVGGVLFESLDEAAVEPFAGRARLGLLVRFGVEAARPVDD